MLVAAIFKDLAARKHGLQALHERGVPEKDIAMVGSDDDTGEDPAQEKLALGSTVGAAIGGGLGILAGAGLLLVPGLGAVTALALSGAGLGAITGALSDWAISEHHGHRLRQATEAGKRALLVHGRTVSEVEAVLQPWADEVYAASE